MKLFAKRALDEVLEAIKVWEKKHEAEFQNERRTFVTESGIHIKRVYTPLDLAEKGFEYMKDLGLPGEYPYTRNNKACGYRAKLWGPSAYSGHADPAESNKLWKAQVEAGQKMVSMAHDLPCQLGLDPDHPKAAGEVGRVGVSMVTQRDWEVAFDGIDFHKVGVYQIINAPTIVGLANHIVLAQKRGMKVSEISGMQQGDTLKEYMARGNYIYPVDKAIRLVGDTLAYAGKNMPLYQAITVCGVHQSEKGANNIHEAAFAIANATTYLQAAVNRGIDIDIVAPSVMFLPGGDHYVFWEEVAKMRAMRKIYARIMKEQFKAKKPESMQCRIYPAEGGTSLHREQYLNNIGRITLAAMSSALAGCEYMDTRTYDEQFGIPTVEAGVNSIRCQNVVAYETGIDDTVDPLAGSYYIEWLTLETEERILKELEEIDRRGGIVQCLETGYPQKVIAEDAYRWQKKFEAGELKRVGVNIFKSTGEEEKPVRIYRANPALEEKRKADVAEVKRKRDNAKVRKALDEVRAIAAMEATADNNLIPPVIDAMAAYATLGEVCDALRDVWGEYHEPSIF